MNYATTEGGGKSINFIVQALASSLFKGAQRFYGSWIGLSVPEMRIISSLDSHGPMAATELAAFTAMDKALVSRLVASLKKRGIITAVLASPPHRCVWELRRPGRELVSRMRPIWRRREALLLAKLSETERKLARILLDRLFQASEELRIAEADALAARPLQTPRKGGDSSPLMETHVRWILRQSGSDATRTARRSGVTRPSPKQEAVDRKGPMRRTGTRAARVQSGFPPGTARRKSEMA